MQLLKEITDTKFPETELGINIREASRAIIFDKNGLIALLFASKLNFHKLPGGGIEAGEDKKDALAREAKEEVGCEIEIIDEIGKIIEFRSKQNLKQTSYCYLCKVVSKGNPDFTEKELNEGFKIIRVSLDEAISLVENDKPENYEGVFVQKREIVFLKKAKELKG